MYKASEMSNEFYLKKCKLLYKTHAKKKNKHNFNVLTSVIDHPHYDTLNLICMIGCGLVLLITCGFVVVVDNVLLLRCSILEC